jgi:outer membrane protein
MMKTRLLLLVAAAIPLRAEGPAERTFTLEQSVQTALQNNPALLVVSDDARIAEHRVREAWSSFLPKVDLQLNGSRYLAEQATVISPDLGTTLLPPSRHLQADTFYTARLGLKQNLYNGGRMSNTVRLAKAGLEQTRIQQEQLRGQVVLTAVSSFYDVLLSRKKKALAEEAAQRADTLADRAPAGEERIALEALQGRFRRLLAENRRREDQATLEFLNTLGLELYTSVALAGELTSKPVSLELNRLLAQAQESRLELRATHFQSEIDQVSVNLLKAERFPVVALGAAYEYNDPSFPLRSQLWHATLNVSLPIFDGFSSRARIRQTRLRVNRNRVQRGQVQDRISTEVRDAYGELMYWQSEMTARGEELSHARTALEKTRRDLAARVQAESWALEAGQAYWESVHGHRIALTKLEKAVGRPIQ